MENLREIDKKIAQRFFGWKTWRFYNPDRAGAIAFEYETLVPEEYDGSNLQYLDMEIPHYSTDIVAAWPIVDKLIGLGHRVGIILDEHGPEVAGSGFAIVVTSNTHRASAKTLPLAICLAALESLEEKVS